MTDLQGYFALHRRFWNSWLSPINRGEKFDDGLAFIYLISEAAIKDKFKIFNGIRHELKRGEVVFSYRDLAEKWKWHRDTVKRFIELLATKDDPELTIVRVVKNCTIARINNYNAFQPDSNKNTANEPANERPMNGQSYRRRTVKQINTHLASEFFKKFFAEYPRPEAEASALAVWNKKQLDLRFAEVMAGLKRWSPSVDWTEQGGRFIPRPAKFLEDELFAGNPRQSVGSPQPKTNPFVAAHQAGRSFRVKGTDQTLTAANTLLYNHHSGREDIRGPTSLILKGEGSQDYWFFTELEISEES